MKYITVLLMLAVVSCSEPPTGFVTGDTVCLNGMDSKGVVKYVHEFTGTVKVIFSGGNEVRFIPGQHKLISKCK